ncbi:hypothetical protein ACHHYP_08615 [Achlya hypogyna]|uniref:Uncharacterized protein n=1 Tax=Achlya hypogyna TaxID=1202772 RepID=A0A1V9ZKC0_ACHHY|nr:hypothetical protein ACHHYP_08615 [Achlya hypogyna]
MSRSTDVDDGRDNNRDTDGPAKAASGDLQLELAPDLTTGDDDGHAPPRNRSLRSKLAAALAEIDEQRFLLEAAAANGQILVEKYFVLEQERDALAARCGLLMLDSDVPHHQPTAVQKCIDLEQQLHAIEREKGAADDMIAKQDQEILFWRTKATACLKDHATLKDAFSHLERENEANLRAKVHLGGAAKRLQQERDELTMQVRDLTSRVADLSERENRWSMANDIKQQKIQRLEGATAELEEALAVSEAGRSVMATRVAAWEQEGSYMQCTINGLKMSLASLEQEYMILLEKTTLAAPNKESIDDCPSERSPLLRKKTPLAPRKSCSPFEWAWGLLRDAIGAVVRHVRAYTSGSYHSLGD